MKKMTDDKSTNSLGTKYPNIIVLIVENHLLLFPSVNFVAEKTFPLNYVVGQHDDPVFIYVI